MNGFVILFGIIAIAEGIVIKWLLRNSDEKKKVSDTITFFKQMWGRFVIYVLATSIIGLFLGSVYFKQIIGLNEINAWVGIVLGLVALIIGIISLYLSFYNVEQANETQEKTVEIIKDFQDDMVDRMNKLQKDVEHKIDESREKTVGEINGRFMVSPPERKEIKDLGRGWMNDGK